MRHAKSLVIACALIACSLVATTASAHSPRPTPSIGTPVHRSSEATIEDILGQLDVIEDTMRTARVPRRTRRMTLRRVSRIRAMLDRLVLRPRIVVVEAAPVVIDPGPQPMAAASFDALRATVSNVSFDRGKLAPIKTAARDVYFTVAQTRALLDLMTFDRYKLDAMRILAPRILDRESLFELYGAFTFSSSQNTLRGILAR